MVKKFQKHLAIMPKTVIESILNGQKKIETRFSKHRIIPFGVISAGDIVYLKSSSSDILGQFRVKKVICYEGLDYSDIEKLFVTFGEDIQSGDLQFDESFFKSKKTARFGTLIFIGETERLITAPFKFRKRDRRGWVILDN